MELKYVGPKPIISHTGIEFDNNKEDKYVYLNIVVQLLKALDHNYFDNKTYVYKADTNRLSSDELYTELNKYCPNLNALMDKENHTAEDEIQHQIQRAHDNHVLNDADKEVLENNINIMHDYLIQRSVNKAVYYCAVKSLANLLKEDHISYVVVPMFQTFFHVLHSVQGALKANRIPIDSKLNIYKEAGQLLVKLEVLHTH